MDPRDLLPHAHHAEMQVDAECDEMAVDCVLSTYFDQPQCTYIMWNVDLYRTMLTTRAKTGVPTQNFLSPGFWTKFLYFQRYLDFLKIQYRIGQTKPPYQKPVQTVKLFHQHSDLLDIGWQLITAQAEHRMGKTQNSLTGNLTSINVFIKIWWLKEHAFVTEAQFANTTFKYQSSYAMSVILKQYIANNINLTVQITKYGL